MFIHPSTQTTKIWTYTISRDLIGEIWTLLYFGSRFTYFQLILHQYDKMVPIERLNANFFTCLSTQPTKIWSYSISRYLIVEIWTLLYLGPPFYLFSAHFAPIWQHGANRTLLNTKFLTCLSTHLQSLPKIWT